MTSSRPSTGSTSAPVRGRPLVLRRRKKNPRWMIAVASSLLLARLARLTANLLLVAGVGLTLFGLVLSVGGFTADLATLTRYAGGPGAVASSTGKAVQSQVLGWFGAGGGGAGVEVSRAAPRPGNVAEYDALQATLTTLQTAVAGLPTPGPQPTASPEAALTATPAAPAVVPVTGEQDQQGAGLGFVPYRVDPEDLNLHAPELTNPALAEPTPQNTAEPVYEPTRPPPGPPTRILIPRIDLDAPVALSLLQTVWVDGHTFQQWDAPTYFAAGWQEGSALAGAPGNIVINGHHNIYEMVFARLLELTQGDEIILFSGDQSYTYRVSQVMTLEENPTNLAQRQENARWILSSDDERLTLVTCWPPASNSHRLLVIAVPGN